jgi:hypothetical protein
VFSNPLFSTDGERIGRDWAGCRLQFGFAVHCKATALFFGRGTIEVAGTLNDNHNHIAITGGTGERADAGGEIRVANTRLFLSILHLHQRGGSAPLPATSRPEAPRGAATPGPAP